MKLTALKGELGFAAFFAVIGLVWIGGSLELPFWTGFAPNSGFLPMVYGGLLVVLSAAVAASLLLNPVEDVEREPLTKSLMILAALVVSVGMLGVLGFLVPLFGLMLFLYAYVERLPLVRAIVVSAATTAILALIFEHWLSIPLPLTPWDS